MKRKAKIKPKAPKQPRAAKRPVMAQTGPASPANSTDNITIAELLDLAAPPRPDTTGFHLTNAGPNAYVLTIQGPEARWLTARVLEFVEALHERAATKAAK